MSVDQEGLILCLRFAYPPNSLHFCGPERQDDIRSYLIENKADNGLVGHLAKFETLYPYLKLIAGANNIKDPFDKKVVEAYWIGNELLKNVKPQYLYRHIADEHFPKISKKQQSVISAALPGVAHHNWHVFGIFSRTGNITAPQTINTMDNCRISWGIVEEIKDKMIKVKYRKLLSDNGHIKEGPFVEKTVFSENIKLNIGDCVAMHWDWICSCLTLRQQKYLTLYTPGVV